MALTEPTLADPIRPEDAWQQAATRETPFGQYLGEKLLGGLEGMRPFSALEMAMLPPRSGVPDEYGIVAPPGPSPVLDKTAWEASPHFRPGIEYDAGMTEARAEALATQKDRLDWNASLIARYQGGFMGQAAGFVAGLAPGIADPTNYVPLLGPAAKAAMVARLGVIGGNVLAHGAEAAANSALFEPLTAEHARTFGQPYGWEDAAADIALGALAGSVGGAIHGGLEYRGSLREAATRTRLDQVMAAADATSLAAEQVDRGLPVDVAPVLAGRLPRAPQLPPGIDAYHGTPHTFDRFSSEKIDTGEGAQAFGHGLYFAEAQGVAEGYRAKLTGDQEANSALGLANRVLTAEGVAGDAGAAITELRARAERATEPGFKQKAEDAIALIREGKAGGSLYKVRLAVEPERLLDWDKSVSAQLGPVRDALAKIWADGGHGDLPEGASGGEVYDTLKQGRGARDASRVLREAGVHGIRYLDRDSRVGGEGTRNLVVFDEGRVHVLERNGTPSFATAAPEEPHPSVAEAAKRVGKASDPLATFKQDAALEGYEQPLPGHEPKAEPGAAVSGTVRADAEAPWRMTRDEFLASRPRGGQAGDVSPKFSLGDTPEHGPPGMGMVEHEGSSIRHLVSRDAEGKIDGFVAYNWDAGKNELYLEGLQREGATPAQLREEAGTLTTWVRPDQRGTGLAGRMYDELQRRGVDIDAASGLVTTEAGAKFAHRRAVERAVAAGKDVPARVLADYPGLADPKPAKPSPPPTREEKAAATAALPPELQDVEHMRRAGDLPEGAERRLGDAERAAQAQEAHAAATEALVGCVMRHALPGAASAASKGINWQDAMDRLFTGSPGLEGAGGVPLTRAGRADRFAIRRGGPQGARGGGPVAEVGAGTE